MAAVALTQPRQRLGDALFETARRRPVVAPIGQPLGQIPLARGIRIGLVVGVAITFAVAQILHERGGRIAQRHRHLERTELLHIRVRFLERGVDGVALRRTGEIDDGVGEREFALRAAEAVVGGPGVDGELQAARVGQTDVLHRHAHDAPREIARITTTVDHTAEPVKRGIRVGAAHAFV